ncbi:hypothetical protein AB0F72_08320 [Actinoplanes sp. NPDC023936]|uniref:hypothetical protein n=1 Tax=Actinoplanes sp. NPDC023936 TaxID=3154910 RepID=UPI0033E4E3A1
MTGPEGLPAVDPHLIEQWLADAGFTPAGGRSGAYSSWGWPESSRYSTVLTVPLDPSAPEYAEMMRALLAALADMAAAGERARTVLRHVLGPALPHGAPLTDLAELAAGRNAIVDQDAEDWRAWMRGGRT